MNYFTLALYQFLTALCSSQIIPSALSSGRDCDGSTFSVMPLDLHHDLVSGLGREPEPRAVTLVRCLFAEDFQPLTAGLM